MPKKYAAIMWPGQKQNGNKINKVILQSSLQQLQEIGQDGALKGFPPLLKKLHDDFTKCCKS